MPPAVAAAGLIAGGTIGGALISSNASAKAAQAQSDAAGNALAFQRQVYQNNQTNMQPYLDLGSNATGDLSRIYGFGTPGGPSDPNALKAFTETPDYKFALSQGTRALDMSAASKHLLNTGGMVRASQDYGQGLAGAQYGSVIARLMDMIRVGQGGASSLALSSNQSAGNMGNFFNQQGQAQASGIIGQANPFVNALNTGPGNALAAGAYFNNPNNNPFGNTSYTTNPLSLAWKSGGTFDPMQSGGAVY